ncbi:SMP-30/gluconolactonase/LRE family protein [Polaribacter batillariae]|uniref:SMP-30/gluconolactonase/LRE family protein n=1 Tax=Polaribacter batillariae TaxID=2808900 RepID=A0ABX7SSE8_9FLAO|nr:SMP-30/gluconolactonase/LRE family protein [Polaribacter batillariae]QTD36243.1 SMP-30/gluconolactonase/LRE family protein [Polaribacter batillariae]
MLKKTFLKALPLLLVGIFYSCKEEKLSNKSIDFTKEFLFTKGIEGPAVDSQGNLYAVNFQKEGTIGKVDKNGNTSLFIQLPNNSIGNGIRFDKNDNMFIADYVNHHILQVRKGEKSVRIFASDATMNQPNDLAIAPNVNLYASDPNWSKNSGNLWLIKDEKITLLEKDMGTTNGVEVSPDGKKLYVNESVQRNIWVYDINSDGTVTNKKLFKKFTDFGMDGMRCDTQGNLYVCRYGKGTVVMLSPEGKMLREIELKGKNVTNIAFGGKDKKQCFVTVSDRGCFETFFAEFPGRSF